MPSALPNRQPPPQGDGAAQGMIPNFPTYDPEQDSRDYQAQAYQDWVGSYRQQQTQPGQGQYDYSTYANGTNHGIPQNHPFSFRLTTTSTYGQQQQYGNDTQSNVAAYGGFYPENNAQQVYQNPQQQQQQQHFTLGSSAGLPSPSSWTDDGVFDISASQPTSATSYTASTSTPMAARGQQQQQQQQQRPQIQTQPQPQSSSPPNNKNRNTGAKRKRKLPETSRTRTSDDDSGDDDDFGISVGMGGLTGVSGTVNGKRGRIARLPGACTHCKKLKMKCDFPQGDNTCKRCKTGGHVCIVEGRKPRTAPNKREYLLAQIRQKDSIIESLLRQLHNPYIATPLSIASYRMATSPSDTENRNVIAWLDRLQSSVQNAGGKIGKKAFRLDDRANEQDESDGEEDMTHAQRFGIHQDQDQGENETEDAGEDNGEGGNANGLPDSHVPLGLIANLSLSNNVKGKAGAGGTGAKKEDLLDEADLDDDNVGVANETYFMPGPATDLDIRATLIEQHSPPEILVHGLVTPDDVDRLFEIFYQKVNPFVSLLDPALHTPASTFARCPFLFTVICAVSSRYYAEKSEIYPIAMHFAKHSAANALVDGWKSVELCQAYILMSIYAVPARRWEEDRSWLYTGLAIRIATDLNLHLIPNTKPHNEKQEREMLNRIRVWMICFNLDRSTATQFGKPLTIKEDFIIRTSADWYKKSQYNTDYDVHLCAHTALLRIVAKFHEDIFSDPNSPSGLNKRVDFRTVTIKHDENLIQYEKEWTRLFKEQLKPDDPGSAFRCTLLPFLVAYSRLVMFSFGFQQAYQRGVHTGDNFFLTKCLESAKAVLTCMIDSLAPSGYMRHAPDGHFVFASFASAFLLKLLRPEFNGLLPKEEGSEIYQLIGKLIQTLSSPQIAIDDRHTPKLYARFLAGLLSGHRRDGSGATIGRLQPQPPAQQQITNGAGPSGVSASMGSFSVGNSSSSNFDASGTSQQTPVYRAEATYAGAIQIDVDPMMLDFEGNGSSDGEMLATMRALKNPSWWSNMMMPGFSWPDNRSSISPSNSPTPPSYNPQQHTHDVPLEATHPNQIMNASSSYGIFHAAPQQIPLSGY